MKNNEEDKKECECIACVIIREINKLIEGEIGFVDLLGRLKENDLSEETREALSVNLLAQATESLKFAIKQYLPFYAYSLNFKKYGTKDEK